MRAPGLVSAMADRLSGRVAIITGGASGIGAATVRRFVDEGASVLVADLDEDKADALMADIGLPDRVGYLRTDVSKEGDVAAMVSEAVDRFGRLDVLFNNAGFGGALGPVADTSVDDYDLTFDVLLKSVFLGVKYAAPILMGQQSGSIINTASVAGLRSGYAPHLYSVAKAAVIAMTKTFSLELADAQVRCNAICPGFIATPLAFGRPDATEEQIDKMRKRGDGGQPLGRVGEPVDIANMAVFLASDESIWITGQEIAVDGGFSVGPPWAQWAEPFRTHRPIRHHRPPDR